LKLISVRRGYDPRDFTLVAFGGGGPTHAPALLTELGARRIVIPPFPGTFSAWGMLLTEPRVDRVQTRVLPLETTGPDDLDRLFAESESDAIAALTAQGFAGDEIPPPRRSFDMRYRGQEHTVEVPVVDGKLDAETLAAAFHDRHRQRYTFALAGTAVEIVNLRLVTTARISRPRVGGSGKGASSDPQRSSRGVLFADAGHARTRRIMTPVYARALLPIGQVIAGPAIVEEPSATTVVHPGQLFVVDDLGNLEITTVPGEYAD
jgi:N-methylhydantoinase A